MFVMVVEVIRPGVTASGPTGGPRARSTPSLDHDPFSQRPFPCDSHRTDPPVPSEVLSLLTKSLCSR